MKYTDFIQEIENDPEYQQAKESLKLHFALGDAVISARIKLGWSQAELAEQVGTKQANISRIEAGLANPTLGLIWRIIQVLDIDVTFSSAPTTSTAAMNFGDPSIPAPNWPVPTRATNTSSHVNLGYKK